MSICTGMGDDGKTSLCGGEKMPKCNICFTALGDLDELSAALGLIKVMAQEKDFYENLQKTIIKISAYIATKNKKYTLSEDEAEIPQAQENITLTEFSLPGKNEFSARLHFARTVSRRAERSFVALTEEYPCYCDPWALVFLNRLSDALFIEALKNE